MSKTLIKLCWEFLKYKIKMYFQNWRKKPYYFLDNINVSRT